METIPSTSSMPSIPTGRVRNTFLTVICILTFIGSGWGTIKAVRSYVSADFTASVARNAMKDAEDKIDKQDNAPSFVKQIMGSVMEDMNPDFLRKLAIFSFISNLLTLSGAILMWKLNKTGFYLYVAGVIVSVGSTIALGKIVGIIGASMVGFVGVVFIVMYAVNLKQMDKKE